MSWVGVDPGEKRTGLARMDGLEMVAHPQGIVDSEDALVSQLEEWLSEERLSGVVIGLPRNMDGSLGPLAKRSLELVKRLRERVAVPFYLWDERLTTQQLVKQGLKGRGQHVDDKAAAILLQSYVDAGKPKTEDPIIDDSAD